MHETWYLLEDGTVGNPAEVAPDAAGALRHKNGVAVAVGPYGPRSRGVNLDDVAAGRESVAVVAPEKKAAPRARDRQMKADESGPKYETR